MSLEDISESEFLDGLAELAAALQRDISAHSLNLDPAPDARTERRKRVLQGDYSFLAYTYFPHHIRGTPSQFQAHFCNRFPKLLSMQSGCREWWIAPRGEAKSSLAVKVAGCYIVILSLLQREAIRNEIGWQGPPPPFLDYVVILSAESRLAAKLMAVIKTELVSNAALALDFPEVCGASSCWNVGEFVSVTGVKFEPYGADQAIRGTFHGASRPKVILPDDLISDKEARSEAVRNGRWEWLGRAIDFLGPPDGSVKVIGVGTILNNDDPLSRAKRTIGHKVHHFRAVLQLPTHMDMWAKCEAMMQSEDRQAKDEADEQGYVLEDAQLPSYQYYLANQTKMDEGAITSWPAVRSLYALMTKRAANLKSFNSELQGDPRSDGEKTFGNVTIWTQKSRDWIIFGSGDPSIGQSVKADPSAFLFGGYDRVARRLHVLHEDRERRPISQYGKDLIDGQREFGARGIAFENNGAFEHSRQIFIDAGMDAGVPLPLIGYTATVELAVRVEGLQPYICDKNSPRIVFVAGLPLIRAELDTWPEKQTGHHYDLLSALYGLWWISVTRGNGGGGYTSASGAQFQQSGNSKRKKATPPRRRGLD